MSTNIMQSIKMLIIRHTFQVYTLNFFVVAIILSGKGVVVRSLEHTLKDLIISNTEKQRRIKDEQKSGERDGRRAKKNHPKSNSSTQPT